MRQFAAAFIAFVALVSPAFAGLVINEIMYHPPGAVEDPGEEWVEIYNVPGTGTVDLSGWKFSKAVNFTFPPGTTLSAGAHLVVAAEAAKFQASYPTVTNFVGGWSGKLSNNGDTIRLSNAAGAKIAEVTYASEGDWAVRARGAVDLGHQGWMWSTEADGAGRTIELRNPALFSENSGQNWAQSLDTGGTPGAVNGNASSDIAPIISNIKHRPHIPRSTDPIRISARIASELADNVTIALRWRLDGTTPFNSLPMVDTDGDGEVDATIPPQANLAIVEFYLEATDTAAHVRTWPAPARTSNIGVTPETYGQVTNALLQVDNSYDSTVAWVPGTQPIHRIILTANERAELQQIWTNVGGSDQSNASFNATQIALSGSGLDTNYLCDVRNRGNGSRLGPPNNALVSFPNDAKWNGRVAIDFNCRYAHSQVLGALFIERMNVAAQDTAPVQVRFNGANLAQAGAVMYGTYARVEHLGSDWVKHHFPLDSAGNLYQVRDVGGDPAGGNLRYEGTSFAAYADSYNKQTNVDAADYSDLVQLTDVLNNAPAAGYKAAVSQVIDLDQWLTFLAANSLIGNLEGGISTGRGDDYSMYRGVTDPRFRLVEHDLDTTMGFGGVTAQPNNSIFTSYLLMPGLNKLLSDPTILPAYYAKYLELTDRVFNPTVGNPLIDQAIGYLAGSQPAVVAAAKTYLVNRRAGVLAQIPQTYSLTVSGNAADVSGMKQTTDGAATFSGTFNVAKTYSITLNGVLATTMNYRASGPSAAGSWSFSAAVGSGFLKRGLNRVTVNFWDGVNGTGHVLTSLSADVVYLRRFADGDRAEWRSTAWHARTYRSGELRAGSAGDGARRPPRRARQLRPHRLEHHSDAHRDQRRHTHAQHREALQRRRQRTRLGRRNRNWRRHADHLHLRHGWHGHVRGELRHPGLDLEIEDQFHFRDPRDIYHKFRKHLAERGLRRFVVDEHRHADRVQETTTRTAPSPRWITTPRSQGRKSGQFTFSATRSRSPT